MSNIGWQWWDTFRLHEAACLIAGVTPSPKKAPTVDELPSGARPVFKQLLFAWVMWQKFHDAPEDPKHPKAKMLEGSPPGGGNITEILVSRAEIDRWIKAMGRDSAYQFLPVCAPPDSLSGVTDEAPVAQASTSTTIWTKARKREARAMYSQLRSEGKRNFRKLTAAHYGVSPQRLDVILKDSPLSAPTKKPSPKSVFGIMGSVHKIK